jgi:hypothetical protein
VLSKNVPFSFFKRLRKIENVWQGTVLKFLGLKKFRFQFFSLLPKNLSSKGGFAPFTPYCLGKIYTVLRLSDSIQEK